MILKCCLVVANSSSGAHQLALTFPRIDSRFFDPLEESLIADLLSPFKALCNKPFELTLRNKFTFLGFPHRQETGTSNDTDDQQEAMAVSDNGADSNKPSGFTLFHVALCFLSNHHESSSSSSSSSCDAQISFAEFSRVKDRLSLQLENLTKSIVAEGFCVNRTPELLSTIKSFYARISKELMKSPLSAYQETPENLFINSDLHFAHVDFDRHMAVLFLHDSNAKEGYGVDQPGLLLERMRSVSRLDMNLMDCCMVLGLRIQVLGRMVRQWKDLGLIRTIYPVRMRNVYAVSSSAASQSHFVEASESAELLELMGRVKQLGHQRNRDVMMEGERDGTIFNSPAPVQFLKRLLHPFNGLHPLGLVIEKWGFSVVPQEEDEVVSSKGEESEFLVVVLSLLEFLLRWNLLEQLHHYVYLFIPERLVTADESILLSSSAGLPTTDNNIVPSFLPTDMQLPLRRWIQRMGEGDAPHINKNTPELCLFDVCVSQGYFDGNHRLEDILIRLAENPYHFEEDMEFRQVKMADLMRVMEIFKEFLYISLC